MAERDVRERDILVAGNEYAYVQDLTKGDIVLYVGPTKISLSNTERLVELRNDRFVPVRGDEPGAGVHPFVAATSAQYIVLENPTKDAAAKSVKGSNSATELLAGRRVVVPGPATFPLWPGQRAKVVDGHQLREGQYLVVRVTDKLEGDDSPIGTEKIIRGADVSFFVPRTGLEVVASDKGYVRQAWRLRRNMGLHVRVLRPFTAGPADQVPPGTYAAGQDLFLHDREGFFYPTLQLEVLGEVYAIPIAEKEGIYVRELLSGRIRTVAGPTHYLPDPTREELVPRAIDPTTAALYGVAPRKEGSRALSIYIPPSTAVMVTAKNKREIVKGPQTRILEFDEELEVLQLSTGRPKTDEKLLATSFLQIEGNKVSDVVRVKTADHVDLEVTLSYRVTFVPRDGEAERWFHVKNYVALLCDHLSSILRGAARATSIEQFHATGTEIVRTAILGEKVADGKRAGRRFDENDMWVYDVEVLEVRILDEQVKVLLADAQRTAIVHDVHRKQEQLRLVDERLKEDVDRQIFEARIATLGKAAELEGAKRDLSLAQAGAKADVEKLEKLARARADAEALEITSAARLSGEERHAELARRELEAKVAAFQKQMEALHPELVATLKMLGNQQLAAELSKNLSPLAILGGESVSEVVSRLLANLPLGTAGADGIRQLVAPPPPANGPKTRPPERT